MNVIHQIIKTLKTQKRKMMNSVEEELCNNNLVLEKCGKHKELGSVISF